MLKRYVVCSLMLSTSCWGAFTDLIAVDGKDLSQAVGAAEVDARIGGKKPPETAVAVSDSNAHKTEEYSAKELFADFGRAFYRTKVFNALSKYTPHDGVVFFDKNDPQTPRSIMCGIAAIIHLAFGGFFYFIDGHHMNFADFLRNPNVQDNLMLFKIYTTLGLGYLALAVILILKKVLQQVPEEEIVLYLDTLKDQDQSAVEDALAILQSWFDRINAELGADVNVQMNLERIDAKLYASMMQVVKAQEAKKAIEQKRHPTNKEIADLQKQQAKAYSAFAERVLTILNDNDRYISVDD